MTAVSLAAVEMSASDGEGSKEAYSQRAVRELYETDRVRLIRYSVLLGLDRGTAEEIVQESFLKLHQHIQAGKAGDNLRAWLYKVVHNLAFNRQTAAQSKLTVGADEGWRAADASASPERLVLEKEQQQLLQRALGNLSASQKNCLLLRSQGLKYREIAEILQLSTSAVAENVTRGLFNLRKVL